MRRREAMRGKEPTRWTRAAGRTRATRRTAATRLTEVATRHRSCFRLRSGNERCGRWSRLHRRERSKQKRSSGLPAEAGSGRSPVTRN